MARDAHCDFTGYGIHWLLFDEPFGLTEIQLMFAEKTMLIDEDLNFYEHDLGEDLAEKLLAQHLINPDNSVWYWLAPVMDMNRAKLLRIGEPSD